MKCTAKILFALLFFHGITQIRNFFRKVSQPWYTNTITHTQRSLDFYTKLSSPAIFLSLSASCMRDARYAAMYRIHYTCQHSIHDMLQLLHHSTLTSSQFSFQQHNIPKCHREEMMQFCWRNFSCTSLLPPWVFTNSTVAIQSCWKCEKIALQCWKKMLPLTHSHMLKWMCRVEKWL